MEDFAYPDFTMKMRDAAKVYNNFSAILEKTEIDGNLNRIHTMITEILGSELHFAFKGWLNRA